MTELEKVIDDLGRVMACGQTMLDCGTESPMIFKMIRDAADNAIVFLKAQEPRLVEPNDFENADDFNWLPAWCEERTGAGYWEMILPDALDEKDVRYWTGRPTDEQREKVKWE